MIRILIFIYENILEFILVFFKRPFITAEQSYRFPPIFQAGWWWRMDLSRRTADADAQHFSGEWTGAGITSVTGTPLQFVIPRFKKSPIDENGLYAVDRIEIKMVMTDIIAECVASANVSAELRLWYCTDIDAPVWRPWFWGVIDLDDINPDVMACIEGTWLRTVEIVAYDGLQTLSRTTFRDATHMEDTTYKRTISAGTADVFIGATNMLSVFGRFNETLRQVIPQINTVSRIISVRYYLEEIAKVCFAERRNLSTDIPLAAYGISGDTIESPFMWRAYTVSTGWPKAYIEKGFRDLWMWYDMFSAEWKE